MNKLNAILIILCFSTAAFPAMSQDQSNGEGPSLDVDTKLPVGPILLGSFSIVAIAVGAGFGWQADQEYDNWKDAQKAGQGAEMDNLADDVKKHSVTANILMFGGAGLLATSIIWLVVDRGANSETDGETHGSFSVAQTRWRPVIGPNQAGLVLNF